MEIDRWPATVEPSGSCGQVEILLGYCNRVEAVLSRGFYGISAAERLRSSTCIPSRGTVADDPDRGRTQSASADQFGLRASEARTFLVGWPHSSWRVLRARPLVRGISPAAIPVIRAQGTGHGAGALTAPCGRPPQACGAPQTTAPPRWLMAIVILRNHFSRATNPAAMSPA
jgi:hypothetical protein